MVINNMKIYEIRVQKMDEFLKYWRDICLQNPNQQITAGHVYNTLINQGISKKDSKKNEKIDLKNYEFKLFEYWVKRFSNVSNINVFVSENWKYFCQFTNDPDFYPKEFEKEHESIKIYIPLSSAYLKEGADQIFDYLAQNNIHHHSKIGREYRFDNIVVRLQNPEDAKRLADFVSNNKFIQDGLCAPNPFAFQYNGVAYACDDMLSYNSTMAAMIASYIDEKKKNDELETVGIRDYYDYIKNTHKYLLSLLISTEVDKDFSLEKEGIIFDEINSDIDLYDIDYRKYTLLNYIEIIGLSLKLFEPDFSYDDYIEHYRHSKFKSLKKLDDLQQISAYYNLLVDIIATMTKKFGINNIDSAFASLDLYLKTGNAKYITRNNNLRERVISSNLRLNINQILSSYNMQLYDYLNQLGIDKSSIIEKCNFSEQKVQRNSSTNKKG